MPTQVRVGVIGVGVMGADHAHRLRTSVPHAVVSAVADLDAARVRSVAAAQGARAFDDPFALVADAGVDAVLVASHDGTHAELVRASVAAGKPVLCEKPLAPSLAEVVALLGKLGARGRELVSVGFMRRFDPGYARLRATVRDGELGAPLVVHCVSRGVRSGPGATAESSVTGSSIHDLDVVPWLLGAPVAEAAWLAPRRSSRAAGLQDPQLLLLRTADGALTTVETYLNAGYGYDIRCEIVCESGATAITEPAVVVRDAAFARASDYAADWRPRFAEAYRCELTAWVRAAAAGGTPAEPMAGTGDALAAAAVAEAVIASMHDGGRFVRVDVPALPEGS